MMIEVEADGQLLEDRLRWLVSRSSVPAGWNLENALELTKKAERLLKLIERLKERAEASEQERAGITLDRLDAEADRWAEKVDLVSMIKAAASPARLVHSAPDVIRERFIARMESQFDAIIRQAFIEGAFRVIDSLATAAAASEAESEAP